MIFITLLPSPSSPTCTTCILVGDQEWVSCDSGIIWETYMSRLHSLTREGSTWWWLSTFLDVRSICTIKPINRYQTCNRRLVQNQYSHTADSEQLKKTLIDIRLISVWELGRTKSKRERSERSKKKVDVWQSLVNVQLWLWLYGNEW